MTLLHEERYRNAELDGVLDMYIDVGNFNIVSSGTCIKTFTLRIWESKVDFYLPYIKNIYDEVDNLKSLYLPFVKNNKPVILNSNDDCWSSDNL